MRMILTESKSELFVTRTDIALLDRVSDKLTLAARFLGMQDELNGMNRIIKAVNDEFENRVARPNESEGELDAGEGDEAELPLEAPPV